MNLLDLLIAIPAIGFILTLLIPRKQEQAIRMFTLGIPSLFLREREPSAMLALN